MTQGRREAYFRLEWKLADERTHLMAKGTPFLFPVTIDETGDRDALVPDSFLAVQWTKAPGGELPPAFCARIAQLLDGGSPAASPAASRTAATRPTQRARPAWVWLAASAAGLAVAAAIIAFRTTKSSSVPSATAAVAPVSEARKLAAQAEALLADEFNTTKDNFDLAEEFCRRALALDSTDAEIWALAARISFDEIFRTYDLSDRRLELGREQAQRALKLDPNSINAGLAVARYHYWSRNRPAAEQIVRDLLSREPAHRRALRLAADLARTRNDEAAVADFLARLQALPGGDLGSLFTEAHHLINVGRYVEAGALLDRVIAQNPGRLPCYEKFYLLVRGWADYDEAKKFLTQIPDRFLDEDSFVAMAARMWISVGDGEASLAVLQRVPREFLEEFGISEPKGYNAGWAQKIAGRQAAAMLEWQQALALVETRLAGDRKNLDLLETKALLQASLGQKAEAKATLNLCLELGSQRRWSRGIFQTRVLALTGDTETAIIDLTAQWPTLPFHLRSYLRGDLSHAPQFAAIRGDPRVQRLIAEHTAELEKLKRAPSATAAKVDDKSVAVLAFANLSSDKEQEYFSDGISEELLNVLAKVPGLKVTARTSAFHFKGKDTPIPEIARQLGVAYVVEGSVRKAGDKVRITAQLIKAADGFHVWSDTFTRDLKDIFAVQDEIAGLIARNLQLKLGGEGRATKVVNPEAYALLLEGRHYITLRSEADFNRAEERLRAALELEPQLAAIHSGIAEAAMLRGVYRMLDGSAGEAAEFDLSRQAAARAMQLDPAMAEPHYVLGMLYLQERRYAESEQAFREGIRLNPNFGVGRHWYGLLLAATGRFAEVVPEMATSIAVDPLAVTSLYNQARFLDGMGRTQEALMPIERAVALRPTFFPGARATRATLLFKLGRKEEALAEARAVRDHPEAAPRWWSDGDAIYVIKQLGAPGEAESYFAQLRQRMGADNHTIGYALAALGEAEKGLRLMETSNPIAWTQLYYMPTMDALQGSPQLRSLFTKLGALEHYERARRELAAGRQQAGATR
jgi:TolB-like protein/Tfp pilus assembly protein PilF